MGVKREKEREREGRGGWFVGGKDEALRRLMMKLEALVVGT
jgi:hypothetical protein